MATTALLPAAPSGVSGNFRFKDEMVQALQSAGANVNVINDFLRFWSEHQFGSLKVVLALISKADEARTFAKFCYTLKLWKVDFGQIARIFVVAQSIRTPRFIILLENVVKNAAKLEKVAKAAEGVGIVVTAIEVYVKIEKTGDWGVLPAEIYKFAIGKAVPWAAALAGFQSLLDGLLPDSTKAGTMFRVLRAIDPVGLGGVAVDAAATLAGAAFDAITRRNAKESALIPRLDRLVQRMRESPAAPFTGLGDNLGDALYDMSQMDHQDWKLAASYTWQQFKGLFGAGR